MKQNTTIGCRIESHDLCEDLSAANVNVTVTVTVIVDVDVCVWSTVMLYNSYRNISIYHLNV